MTDDLTQRAEQMAVALESAPIYDNMGLSLTHSQAADVLRWLSAALVQAEQALGAAKIVNCEMLQCPYEVRAKAAEAKLVQAEQREAQLQEKLARVVDTQYAAPLATAGQNEVVPTCQNCEAMRRAAKVLPRPWIDGGVTWKDWDAACEVLWPRS